MAEPIVEEENIPVEQDAPASPEVFNIEKNLEINPFERNFTPVNLPVDKDWVDSHDYGFFSDVGDEYHASWLGQTVQHFSLDNEYRDAELDYSYNPFLKENLEGYEEYADDFVEVKNQEHHEFLKLKITKNNAARKRLDNSDRFWGPMLTSLLLDPISYVPIPLSGGLSFATRAAKGALVSGGLIGATEPFRQSFDPTSERVETVFAIGGGALMGGVLSGAFGRRGVSNIFKQKGETTADFVNKTSGNLQDSVNEFSGKVDYSKTGFNARLPEGTSAYGFIYKVQDDVSNINVEIRNLKNSDVDDSPFFQHPIARLVSQEGETDVMLLDEVQASTLFHTNSHLKSQNLIGVEDLPNGAFKSADDFMKFEMKKEVLKKKYYPRKTAGDKVDEAIDQPYTKLNEVEYENFINHTALEELQKEATTSQALDTVGFLKAFKRMASNSGRVLTTFNDNIEGMTTWIRAFGDNGVGLMGARYGVASKSSAATEVATTRFNRLKQVTQGTDSLFARYRGGDGGSLLFGVNAEAYSFQIGDVLRKIRFAKKSTDGKGNVMLERGEFNEMVGLYQLDNTAFANAPAEIIESAALADKIFREIGKEAEELNMFASQRNFKNKLLQSKSRQDLIKKAIEDPANGDSNGILKTRLKKMLKEEESRYGGIDDELEAFILAKVERNAKLRSGAYNQDNFLPRHWRIDKIYANPEKFKKILREHFMEDRVGDRALDDKAMDKLVDDTFDTIVHTDGSYVDGDGVLGIGKNKGGSVIVGARSLMSRTLDIDNFKVRDFIELDVGVITEKYVDRMGKAIEMKKVFGDVNMEDWLVKEELRLNLKYLKDKKSGYKIRTILQAFVDEKDKFLGAFNTADPASISKKTASILKDQQSLSKMGKVLITSISEAARPVTVFGWSRTFGVGMYNYLVNNRTAWKEALTEMNWLAEAMDVSMNKNTGNRYNYNSGVIAPSSSVGGKALDKVARGLHQAQSPFYWFTGLTSWTRWWKDFSGVVSQHRFIEDSIKLSKGQGTQKELKKISYVLATYGIDKKTADVIARMPWQKKGNLYMANVEAWGRESGGDVAIKKIRHAIYDDVNRTVVTPTIADRPNMMDGALTFTGDKTVAALDTKLGRALTGAEKTDFGIKVNSSWATLAFQFLGWGFAANNKIVISGLQGRDANALGGTTLAITLGILVGYLKNPYGFDKMIDEGAIDELVLDGVDRSGILGLWSEVDALADGLTRATIGFPISSRVMYEPKYGAEGSIGEFAADVGGPISGTVFNMIEALNGTGKHSADQVMARNMPLYNMLWINSLTKPLYDTAFEKTFERFD